jgi:hypothetical protein
MVKADMIKHSDSFWTKYYAKFVGDVSKYGDFFTGGHYDSYSKTSDAFLSKSRRLYFRKSIFPSEEFALKFYQSRGSSIGLVRVGFAHYVESGFEGIDGFVRSITGRDNEIYNMHDANSNMYLGFRKFFRLWKEKT